MTGHDRTCFTDIFHNIRYDTYITCKRCLHWLWQLLGCASSSSSELMLEYSWKSFQTIHLPTEPSLGEGNLKDIPVPCWPWEPVPWKTKMGPDRWWWLKWDLTDDDDDLSVSMLVFGACALLQIIPATAPSRSRSRSTRGLEDLWSKFEASNQNKTHQLMLQ